VRFATGEVAITLGRCTESSSHPGLAEIPRASLCSTSLSLTSCCHHSPLSLPVASLACIPHSNLPLTSPALLSYTSVIYAPNATKSVRLISYRTTVAFACKMESLRLLAATIMVLWAVVVHADPLCYYAPGKRGPDDFIPCYTGRSDEPTYCCKRGGKCTEQNSCWDLTTGVTFQYGCTDPTYKHSSCPRKCGLDTGTSSEIRIGDID
jgi:hypothetical protein